MPFSITVRSVLTGTVSIFIALHVLPDSNHSFAFP